MSIGEGITLTIVVILVITTIAWALYERGWERGFEDGKKFERTHHYD